MFATPIFMCLASLALGGFVGFDRTLVRASNAVAAHALSAGLGCLMLFTFLFPSLDEVADLSHDRIVETLILATLVAVPVALMCQAFVMLLLAIDARGYPPGDLVSLSSAAWFGAICASGSWRMILLCTLALLAIAIFRPRHKEEADEVEGVEFPLTPMVGQMMVPAALNASTPCYGAMAAGLVEAPTSNAGPRAAQSSSPMTATETPDVVLRPLAPARRHVPLEERMLDRPGTLRPGVATVRAARRSGRLLRDARSVRGYCLRHHRGLQTGTF